MEKKKQPTTNHLLNEREIDFILDATISDAIAYLEAKDDALDATERGYEIKKEKDQKNV